MEGYRDGYEAGKKLGLEKEETARRNGLLQGHELGTQQGKDEEQKNGLWKGMVLGSAFLECTLLRSHFDRGR